MGVTPRQVPVPARPISEKSHQVSILLGHRYLAGKNNLPLSPERSELPTPPPQQDPQY